VIKYARFVGKILGRRLMVNHSLHVMLVLFLFVDFVTSMKGKMGNSLVFSVKPDTRGIKVKKNLNCFEFNFDIHLSLSV